MQDFASFFSKFSGPYAGLYLQHGANAFHTWRASEILPVLVKLFSTSPLGYLPKKLVSNGKTGGQPYDVGRGNKKSKK